MKDLERNTDHIHIDNIEDFFEKYKGELQDEGESAIRQADNTAKSISKKEINEALHKIDNDLGQTLFLQSASIIPDGGVIEVKDDNGKCNRTGA